MEKITNSLPFDNYEIIEAENSKRGLALLWRKDASWEIIFKSQWVIGVNITSQHGIQWSLWCCYCPAEKRFLE